MWNRFLQVFHFNWHYNVLRLQSDNLPILYRYRQRALWTYLTCTLRQLTFSTTVDTTNSYTVQPWGLQFLLLLQKIVMQNIEESALSTFWQTIPLYNRSDEGLTLETSGFFLRWLIYVFNSVVNTKLPLWLRYVDDTLTAVPLDEIEAFHHHKTLTYSLPER